MGYTKRLVVVTLLAALARSSAAQSSGAGPQSALLPGPAAARASAPVCPGAERPDDARCHARVVTDDKGAPLATTGPAGFGPADLQAAYGVTHTALAAGTGPTIAIVDAYDCPTAESDMNAYRSQYGLPPCTSASGCFTKIDQYGGTSYPRKNSGWALEISLDLDMASAICPECKILLVEAATNSFANIATAVGMAASWPGVVAVSNSYGAKEFSTETLYEGAYNHAAAMTVSSGDSGYGVEFPAASRYVTAVGGTSLARDGSTRGWAETAWKGAGSGCSAYVPKPGWQTDLACSRRTVADVSAVADPATGVSVYDTTAYYGQKGWFVVGGTSAAAPIIAGIYALAGNSVTYGSYPYDVWLSNPSALWDVTFGSNGSCGTYLCTAGVGYDGPTGLGTPNGTTGF